MKNKIVLIVIVCFLFASCADVEPNVVDCLEGHKYGFWGGLWHGIIAPFSFIGSLFSNDIAVFAPNNNGGWYTFGFLIGVGGFTFSASSSKK